MSFPRQHHFRRRDRNPNRESQSEFFAQPSGVQDHIHPEHTGSESDYLKSLVDSRAKVTVVLTTGERLQGRIRYYDQDCFSIGLSGRGPRLFLRKENVAYIVEEPPAGETPNATYFLKSRS
jgi:small nuclear ribonucleoprotein (snRNP)-like protein